DYTNLYSQNHLRFYAAAPPLPSQRPGPPPASRSTLSRERSSSAGTPSAGTSGVLGFRAPPDVLEGRLRSQDRPLAVLLEQALRIKEEVTAGLQSSHGSVQIEALSRKLLENHILTITRIVKQLSMGIQELEKEMAQRDSVTSGVAHAVQNMDQKNTAGVGDLRGRVARCDSSIAKLSADVSFREQQVIRLQREVRELSEAVNGQLKELEDKVGKKRMHADKGLAEKELREQLSKTLQGHKDFKLKGITDCPFTFTS
uniref:Family with sequence similarity 81 member B n=1 Tax=Maylandia zebra TaxID=106582 RepID=A0A3P9C8K0_9CICH